ncbi:OsmC family protein [Nocardioides mangrovi]|uniref:OsmC family protein n=1 Tax=Nocardioides mangrovi TaxID=2874580 RepID=A0ABS7UFM0_9ACTN|nr:OsmC family protein [Nocardioides mangrovi]MBZ5739804.1 OsmC family protein [Nocardioides mangrovi]
MADVHVDVRVAAGSLAGDVSPAYVVPHQWTDGGIAVEGGGTGAHLLLTAVASCVLNDVFREAAGVPVDGVLVSAGGDFDGDSWSTTAIAYSVRVDSPATDDAVAQVLAAVDEVAEIPRAVRGEVKVERR